MNLTQYVDVAILMVACIIYGMVFAVAVLLVLKEGKIEAPAFERIISRFQERQRQKTAALVDEYEDYLVRYERWYIKHWHLKVSSIDLSLIAPSFDTWREARGR